MDWVDGLCSEHTAAARPMTHISARTHRQLQASISMLRHHSTLPLPWNCCNWVIDGQVACVAGEISSPGVPTSHTCMPPSVTEKCVLSMIFSSSASKALVMRCSTQKTSHCSLDQGPTVPASERARAPGMGGEA